MREVSRFEEAKLKLDEAKLNIDEYKLWVEDTARALDRSDRLTTTYVTLNAFILGALTFLLRETQFDITWEVAVIIPLLLAGLVACTQWRLVAVSYKEQFVIRLELLKEFEALPERRGRLNLYTDHIERYTRKFPTRPGFFSRMIIRRLDSLLPLILMVVYGSSLASIVVLSALRFLLPE